MVKTAYRFKSYDLIPEAREVGNDYEQLILMEEFMNGLSEECYMGEKKAESMHELAILVNIF